jgi:hypothetical protein
MKNPLKSTDWVNLREDIPELNLVRGQIGCILEALPTNEFEIVFLDDNGQVSARVYLGERHFSLLQYTETLDEAGFWKFIEATKAASDGNSGKQAKLLSDKLAEMSFAEIFAFSDWYDKFRDLARRCDLWAAAYIIEGGCDDDDFTDFQAWLVSQGEKIFHDALRDPETLADIVHVDDAVCVEELSHVYWRAYEKKTGEDMPIIYFRRHPELTGEYWDPSEVDKMFPKLAAKFWPKDYDESPD